MGSDGNELAVPERSCERVLDSAVAATAAYALQGVMNGGTGAQGNPYDGIPVIGKTGTQNLADVARRVEHEGRDRRMGRQHRGIPRRLRLRRRVLPLRPGQGRAGGGELEVRRWRVQM